MERPTSRFERPSSSLEIKALLGKTRRGLWSALVLAIGIHLSLTGIRVFETERSAAKPLTTKFIKRAPRLTKPLELKKRPRPRRRQIQRKMVSIQAKTRREGLSSFVQASQVVSSLARPGVHVRRSVSFEASGVEPEALAEAIEGAKEPQNRIDMALEMVDIDALDTGKYHAMVVQDPTDKRNIKGFFHFARAYSVTMRSGEVAVNWKVEERINYGLMMIVQAMNEYTQIKSDLIGTITFDAMELLQTPWVCATSYYSFSVTESEAANLGLYLLSGGFLFADGRNIDSPLDKSIRDMIRRALASGELEEGRDWAYEKVPSTHPIYHCYFDFDSLPPGQDAGTWIPADQHPNYMLGVTLDHRLVLILCHKYYVLTWGDWGRQNTSVSLSVSDWDNTRQVQFGINTIIFALTQEGSITNRLADAVR